MRYVKINTPSSRMPQNFPTSFALKRTFKESIPESLYPFIYDEKRYPL